MFSFLSSYFNSDEFMPHGHCYLWEPGILWTHVISDACIFAAYLGIPATLIFFMRKRKDFPFPGLLLLFGSFIVLCGATHLMSIWVIWYPDYALQGVLKAATALISIATLYATILLTPKALMLASPADLQKLNNELQVANDKLANLYTLSEQSGQSRLRAVVDNVVDGIITINENGIVETFNNACGLIFGYSEEEVIGQNITMLMPEPYSREYEGYLNNYKKTGMAEIVAIGREISGKRKDGSIFHMDLSISAFELENMSYFTGIVRDISERKEAEKTLEQLRQLQKMEAIGHLTGGIAHDFNNLLAIILGNLDFLNEKMAEHDPLRKYVTPSIAASLQGSELTQRLLAFGRKQTLQPKVVCINNLIAHFSTLVKSTLGERIELTMALAPDIWNVKIDQSQLENVLLNLAVNARDAMPTGGKVIYETRNVILDAYYAMENAEVIPGEYVMLAVSDNGSGMSADILEKAFEPFFTTKDVGKGSGLGLSMVYGFVKQSAGHIKLYSEPGHGTTIRIYLPHATEALPQPEEADDNVTLFLENEGKLILIVEDNQAVLTLTSSMVESLGYKIYTAMTGDAALDILKAHPEIDLLLTDVMLPGALNGPELAKHAVKIYPHLKVIFNSGYAEQTILHTGMLDKDVHLLTKPFRKQQLAQKIIEVLNA